MDAIIAAGIPPMDAIEKQSQYSMPMQGLYAAMKKDDFPSFSPAFCGSEQGMLVIGPDGLIYPCWDLVAMEEDAVGFTDEATGRRQGEVAYPYFRPDEALSDLPVYLHLPGRLRTGSETGTRQLFPRKLRRSKGDFRLCGAPGCGG